MPRGKRATVDIDFQLDGPNIECFVHHKISRLDQVRAAAVNVYCMPFGDDSANFQPLNAIRRLIRA